MGLAAPELNSPGRLDAWPKPVKFTLMVLRHTCLRVTQARCLCYMDERMIDAEIRKEKPWFIQFVA